MKTKLLGALALGLMTAACGTNPTERTTGGAAAGAAAGAGIGALGGPVGALAGAGIGGAAGAVTGAATTPDQVNLGRPLWNDPEVRVPGGGTGRARSQGSSQVREAQQALARQGYDVGPADGVNGPRTRQALMDWQRRNNLPATGEADARTMAALGGGAATGAGAATGGAAGGGTGGLSRPNPTGSSTGAVPAPSNNPMNDPIGGSGSAIQPGFNQNR